jgi:hypothetical protein
MSTIKYPKTHYLPWSRSVEDGDKRLSDMSNFEGKRVIMSEKLDGENCSLYRTKIHARSLDSVNHPSRNWVKNYWATIRHNIPHDIRICGENCYAKHSIHYTDLVTYFYGFNAWRENMCLSWDETLAIFSDLGIVPVKVLYDGVYDEKFISHYEFNENKVEGYVVRLADAFPLSEFQISLGKCVRKNHVQSDEHWMRKAIIPNILGAISYEH